MRPPQNAGESDDAESENDDAADASMRPPQNAGESWGGCHAAAGLWQASMRPPQNAGESLRVPCAFHLDENGFNEAPAERGGKSARRMRGLCRTWALQ